MLEQDRYKFNRTLYLVGMLCLLISMCLMLLSLYCLAYLVWELHYSIPGFIAEWKFQLMDIYELSDNAAGLLTFFILFIPALITGAVANGISNYIDRSLLIEKATEEPSSLPESVKKTEVLLQSLIFMSKILLIIIVVLAVLFAIEWLISVPEPV